MNPASYTNSPVPSQVVRIVSAGDRPPQRIVKAVTQKMMCLIIFMFPIQNPGRMSEPVMRVMNMIKDDERIESRSQNPEYRRKGSFHSEFSFHL
jgi:hypothetical protein